MSLTVKPRKHRVHQDHDEMLFEADFKTASDRV